MALFQPTNITPSDLSGVGTIDALNNLPVTWQVNGTGNTPMTAYKIDIMMNDTESTLLYSTGQVALSDPFYGADAMGNPQYFTATINAAALAAAGVVNSKDNVYKLLITQWWSAGEYVQQSSASVFIARETPSVSITNFSSTISTVSYEFIGSYSQAQGDPIEWARWQISGSANNDVLVDTGRIYGVGELKTSYDGFLNGNNYIIRLSGQTVNGAEFDTGWQTFVAEYDIEILDGAMTTCVRKDTDAVQITFPTPLYTMGAGGGDWEIEQYQYETAGPADVVTVDDAIEAPVKSLSVDIEPVQDLHGQDSPWPAGGGKNLIENSVYVIPDTSSGAAIWTGNLNGTYTISIDKRGITSVTYPEQAAGFVDVNGERIYFVYSTGYVTVSGNITAIYIYGSSAYARMVGTLRIQLEAGSTATAWSPYENICPISGWDEVKVTRAGVNLFDKSTAVVNSRFDTNGVVYAYGTSRSDYVGVKPGTTYFFHNVHGAATMTGVFWYNSAKQYISASQFVAISPASYVATAPDNAAYVGINFQSADLDTVAINYPSTDTAYHSYQGNTYTIEMPTEAGTVYGGVLTVNKDGSGTVESRMASFVMDGDTSKYPQMATWYTADAERNTIGVYWYFGFQGLSTLPKPLISSVYDTGMASNLKWNKYGLFGTDTPYICGIFSMSNPYFAIRLPKSVLADVSSEQAVKESAMSYLAEHPVTVVYEILDPIQYSITPPTITTLLGTNHVWSDAGQTTVQYAVADSPLLILPTNADSVTWDTAGSAPFSIASPFGFVWRAILTDTSASLPLFNMAMANGILNAMASSTGIQVTISGQILFEDTTALANGDDIMLYIQKGAWGLFVNGTGVASGALSNWQDEITSVMLYGPQECLFVWIVENGFTTAQMLNAQNNTPSYDSTTHFLAQFSDGLSAGAIRAQEDVTRVTLYRRQAGKVAVQKLVSSDPNITAVRDYAALNGNSYTYTLVGETDGGSSTSAISSNSISPCIWNYTLMLCSQDSNDFYHVQQEYRFSLDISSGSENNNNNPTLQANFTRYPLRQPNAQNYRSGTLTSFVGKAVNGKYVDSLSEIEALREISTSSLYKFLKNRKGEIMLVDTASPITMTITDKYEQQPVRAAIPWAEVGSAKGKSVITVSGDTYWPNN